MEEKKYIDRLYQEKFKDFEAAPRRDLWKNIAVKLKEEEKKKTAAPPLWTRLAGIAAILSLILLLGDWLTQPSITPVASRQKQESSQKPSSPEALAATESEEGSEIEETAGEKLSDDNGQSIRNSSIAEISSIIPNGIKRSSGEEKKQAEHREEKKEETSRFTKTR